jgi:DNA helicase-2/ATP-dependent DNA helicase PcrA
VTSFGKHICDELAQRAKREGLDCGVRTTHSVGMASILHSMQPFNRAPDPRKLNEIVRRMMREAGMVTLAENVRTVGKLVTRAKADLMQTEQDILSHLDDAPVYFVKERAKGGRRATIEYPPQDKVAQVAWAAVAECARDTGRFDYDDMLWFPVIFLLPCEQWDNVLADELQDFSLCQVQLTRRMVGERTVGVFDTNQVLFGFRGARADNPDRLVEGAQARRLSLTVTWRCAKRIVAEANRYVPELEAAPNAPEGKVETLTPDQALGAVRPGDYVLSRTNAALTKFMQRLRRKRVPCKQLGRDVSGTYHRLIRESYATDVRTLIGWIAATSIAANEAGDFETVDLLKTLEELCQGQRSLDDLTKLIDATFTDNNTTGAVVTLATVHAAKGREADRVFLLWDTFRPWVDDAERNIAYVGITRAKTHLVYVVKEEEEKNG